MLDLRPSRCHRTRLRRSHAAADRHAEAPAPGSQAALLDGPLVEVVRVTAPWAHLNLAVEFYGRGIQGLQLVHADKRGRWPWDDAYQEARGGQPVLGPREPPERRRRAGWPGNRAEPDPGCSGAPAVAAKK